VEDAKRFVDQFQEAIEARHPEVFETIRGSGKLDDATLETLGGAVEEFAAIFAATGTEAGSEAGIGRTTPKDEVREDVGWDRMSSAEDEEGDVEEPAEAG
jgi:hypothetical protein